MAVPVLILGSVAWRPPEAGNRNRQHPIYYNSYERLQNVDCAKPATAASHSGAVPAALWRWQAGAVPVAGAKETADMVTEILNSRFFLWGLLALPSVPMVRMLIEGQPGPDGEPVAELLLHPTGEFAARFMIIAMIITPVRMMFPGSAFWIWMLDRRRYFGVAAFAYAAAHTVLYVVDLGSLAAILGEFLAFGIWTGWAAFFIFVPLALTSNAFSVRLLGHDWKLLQRLVYPAALATLLHWMFVHNDLGPALAHFLPLAALECYRLWRGIVHQARRPT